MKVDENSKLFLNKDFLKDKEKFSLVYKMLKSKEKLFLSDEENYLLAKGTKGYPTWVWTKDNLSNEKLLEVLNLLKENYLVEDENKFTCKKEVYEYFKNNLDTYDYFEMGFLLCKKLNDVEKANGFLDHVKYSDKTLVAKYWQDNSKEMDYQEELTYAEALEEVSKWLDDEHYFVWRNNEGRAVSLGCYGTDNGLAKLSHVYTPLEERCKGYCRSLVYEVTKLLLEEGLTPVLYTDLHYEASNHTYKKVGYEDKGYLVNFKVRGN